MSTKIKMTDEQINQLDSKLHGTTQNVYQVAKSLFGDVEFEESEWDRLKSVGDVFKCEECNHWLTTGNESQVTDMCCDCECEMFADEEDEEDEEWEEEA